MSFDEREQKIKAIHLGWINNFRLANIHEKLKEFDGWHRNRLRYCIWKEGTETTYNLFNNIFSITQI